MEDCKELNIRCIPHGIHMESMWNKSMWNEHGFHVDFMWIPYGFHISKYIIYVVKHIPCEFHVESKESTWNKSVPHGFHMECDGKVLLKMVKTIN